MHLKLGSNFCLAVIVGCFILTGTSILSPSFAQNAPETLPIFKAAKILGTQNLTGANYRIDPSVRNDGFLNHFSVIVDGKQFDVASNALMQVRLRELLALEEMEKIKRSSVYVEAVKKSATGPLRAAKDLITNPVGTVRGIASGIGTFFSGVGHAMFGGASEQEEGVIKTMLGFDIAKRKIAHKFGIDPYTSFAPVVERLNDISWAGVAGGLTVSVGFKAMPKPARGVLIGTKTANAMNQMIRDNTPAELK